MQNTVEQDNYDFEEIQKKRKALHFREDGFVILDEIAGTNSNLPERYTDAFKKATLYYQENSKKALSFALHPILIYTDKEKGIFFKINDIELSNEELTKEFQIFDKKLLELINIQNKQNKIIDIASFLNLVSVNSIVVIDDWVYFWRPDIGTKGTLIATDNDSTDIPFNLINLDKIQHIRTTSQKWDMEGYDFDKEFPDDTYKY